MVALVRGGVVVEENDDDDDDETPPLVPAERNPEPSDGNRERSSSCTRMMMVL